MKAGKLFLFLLKFNRGLKIMFQHIGILLVLSSTRQTFEEVADGDYYIPQKTPTSGSSTLFSYQNIFQHRLPVQHPDGTVAVFSIVFGVRHHDDGRTCGIQVCKQTHHFIAI